MTAWARRRRWSRRLVDEAAAEVPVGVNATVAQEGPVGSGEFDFPQVAFRHQGLLMVVAGSLHDLAIGAGDEALPPELDSILAGGIALVVEDDFAPDAVGGTHEAPVGDRVGAHHELPRLVLRAAE